MAKEKSIVKKKQSNNPKHKSRTNHLLIIGIDEYTNGITTLNNAIRDAQQFKALMVERFQFKEAHITELYNEAATRSNILQTFGQLLNQLTDEDNLVFYYSGHGEQLKKGSGKRGYWIPSDATHNEDWSYIPNSEIIDLFKLSKAHHIFGIVDSCFSGSLFKTRKLSTAVERIDSYPSRWLLTAGRLEVVSDGSLGENSPFAAALFAYLKNTPDDALWVSDLCTRVLKGMRFNTDKQTPRGEPLQEVGHYGGQFVFYKKGYQAIEEERVATSPPPIEENSTAPKAKGLGGGVEIVEEMPEEEASASEPDNTTVEDSKNTNTGNIHAGGNVHIGDIIQPSSSAESLDLGEGKLIHDIPDQMKLQVTIPCKVRIAKDRKILLEDLQTSAKTEIIDLKKITKVMSVELVDISGGNNFNIVTGTSEEQYLESRAYTEWTFYITPLRTGNHMLQLKISTVKIVNHKERQKDIAFLETISVVTATATAAVEKESIIIKPPVIKNLKDLKNYLKGLLKKDLKEALDAYDAIIEEGDNGIVQQLSRYNSNRNDFSKDLISVEQRNRTNARISNALTYMIDELEENSLVTDYQSKLGTPEKMEDKNTIDNSILLDIEQLEQSGLKEQVKLLINKLNYIKKVRITETDASRQFAYDQNIADIEKQLAAIKKQIDG